MQLRGQVEVKQLLTQLSMYNIATVEDAVLFMRVVAAKSQQISDLLGRAGSQLYSLEKQLDRRHSQSLSIEPTEEAVEEVKAVKAVEVVKEKLSPEQLKALRIENLRKAREVKAAVKTSDAGKKAVEKIEQLDAAAPVAPVESAAKKLK